MYNECSSDLKEAMKKYEIEFQLDPPQIHRINAEERAIRTCKNYFISGLSTTNPDYPIRKWDGLIFQCITTLNLIRNSRVNTTLSAYPYLFLPYAFNRSPMAPPVTRVIVHEKTGSRISWGYHGTTDW